MWYLVERILKVLIARSAAEILSRTASYRENLIRWLEKIGAESRTAGLRTPALVAL